MNNELYKLVSKDKFRRNVLRFIYALISLTFLILVLLFAYFRTTSIKVTLNGENKYYVEDIMLSEVLTDFEIKIDQHDYIVVDDNYINVDSVQDVTINKHTIIEYINVDYIEDTEESKIDFKVIEQETDSLLIGESEITIKGSPGVLLVKYELKLINGEEVSRDIIEEIVKVEPVNEIKLVGTKTIEYNDSDSDYDSQSSETINDINNSTNEQSEASNPEQDSDESDTCTITINGNSIPCN